VPLVIIASGEDSPDALGAGSPAALNTGPVLLTKVDSLPQVTQDELTRLAPDRIVIVGGTAAVSTAVETELQAVAPIVERIKGQAPDGNRYGTAAEISKAFFPADSITGPQGPEGLQGQVGHRSWRSSS
jgi:putative cell wall-binding protein